MNKQIIIFVLLISLLFTVFSPKIFANDCDKLNLSTQMMDCIIDLGLIIYENKLIQISYQYYQGEKQIEVGYLKGKTHKYIKIGECEAEIPYYVFLTINQEIKLIPILYTTKIINLEKSNE